MNTQVNDGFLGVGLELVPSQAALRYLEISS